MDIIEIVLPKIEVEDWPSRECHNCGSKMMTGLERGRYQFKNRKYQVRRIRTYKCFKCGEQVYPAEEAKRIEDAIRKKSDELEKAK
jgi:YgiT-type zinc finger domain-containing protein